MKKIKNNVWRHVLQLGRESQRENVRNERLHTFVAWRLSEGNCHVAGDRKVTLTNVMNWLKSQTDVGDGIAVSLVVAAGPEVAHSLQHGFVRTIAIHDATHYF